MSLRIDASTDSAQLTSGLPAGSRVFTIAGWFKVVNERYDPPANEQMRILTLRSGGGGSFHVLGYDNNGNLFHFNSNGASQFGSNPPVGEWVYGFTQSDSLDGATATSGLSGWWDGSQWITQVGWGYQSSAGSVSFGHDPQDATSWLDGKLAYGRYWAHALTLAELSTERDATSLQFTTDIFGSWPLASDGLDESAANNDLTVSATFDTEDDPLGVPVGTKGRLSWAEMQTPGGESSMRHGSSSPNITTGMFYVYTGKH